MKTRKTIPAISDRAESEARAEGHGLIAGVDEAGRGPLAGPVVASAVIFPPGAHPEGIRDSKALSPARRASLVLEIYSSAVAVSVASAWPEEIDSLNIHHASLLAMKRAVEGLKVPPDFLLIDGRFTIQLPLPQRALTSGDKLSVSIAAASIIAKTTRDRLMEGYHRLFPGYNFASHKGYPTREHKEAVKRLGLTAIHRKTFNSGS